METKDLFSDQSKLYAAFRPTYPEALYEFIFSHIQGRESAWDCATGNGQVARRLASEFKQVYASDVSEKQLQQATQLPNISYSIQPAEHTTYSADLFDLITVGQALHWFDLPKFYEEVKRVSKDTSLLAAWGYGGIHMRSDLYKIVDHFYHKVVGEFWEPARTMVEQHYHNVTFPFTPIASPEFEIVKEWNLRHLLGYIESWSATQRYIKKYQETPIPALSNSLSSVISEEELFQIQFPVFLKLGRITH